MGDGVGGQQSDATSGTDATSVSLPGIDLRRVWAGVAAEVWRRVPGPVERVAARVLRSPGLSRALVTTPSLLVPWLLATVVVLGAGVAVTARTGQPMVALVVPVLAGAAVAFAYGPGADPAWELALSAAVSHRMVLLVRVLAVFGVNGALGLAASAVSGMATALTFGWLLPMAAVSALALAVATVARSPQVGALAGLAAWTVTVLAGAAASQGSGGGRFGVAVAGSALALPSLGVVAGCGVVIAVATRSTATTGAP